MTTDIFYDGQTQKNVVRKWVWRPYFNYSRFKEDLDRGLSFGIVQKLIWWDGPKEPREIKGIWLGISLSFKIRSEHIYYDGPHCFYQFGPFKLIMFNWNWDCKECIPECFQK